MKSPVTRLTMIAVLLAACPPAAIGLINPDFTPADLVRESRLILVVTVSAPKNYRLTARTVEALKGEPAAKDHIFDFRDAEMLEDDEIVGAFGSAATATGVLFARRDVKTRKWIGALRIGTTWVAVAQGPRGGTWLLDSDKRELELVWAGSARMLIRGTRYVLKEPGADFPVASLLRFSGDMKLGRLTGPANGCEVVDLGDPIGLCAIVLSDGGDRIYRVSGAGRPVDTTADRKLTTTSKTLEAGDFNGDGRIDLASWDGKALRLALRGADDTFSSQVVSVGLTDCVSLSALGLGRGRASALLVGTKTGPVLLTREGNGRFATRRLGTGNLGPGGVCVAADFDADGHCDVVQAHAKGLAFYPGSAEAAWPRAPRVSPLPMVASSRVAVCGDYDADGSLDVIVGGTSGVALLCRTADGRWVNRTAETAELTRHGNAGGLAVCSVAPCDINSDGRQSVALFYPQGSPAVFFSRGFACFGLARKLVLGESKLKGAGALSHGQSAGAILDLNGDGAQDLLAVTGKGEVWALLTKPDRRRPLYLTLALPLAAVSPVTVSVSCRERHVGTYVVRHGRPAVVGRPRRGPVVLHWVTPDGKRHTRKVVVLRSTRVELRVDAPPGRR